MTERLTPVVLAYPWTDPDGTEHAPDERVELDPVTAKNLIRDGKARSAAPAPPVVGEKGPELVQLPQKSTPVKGAAPQPPTDPKE